MATLGAGTFALPRAEALPAPLVAAFRDALESMTGLSLEGRASGALEAAVERVGQALSLAPEEVLDAFRRGDLGEGCAFERLVSALTVGETHFFRNRPHFEALERVILPEILGRNAERRTFLAWSAGCATGEELYSLAMVLEDVAARRGIDLSTWRVRLVGTDIDRQALAHAAAAEYAAHALRGVAPDERERFFERLGDDRFRVRPRYRRFVEIAPVNLRTDVGPGGRAPEGVDLVLCRNVTIYFTPDATRALVAAFHARLAQGGFLLVGPAEHSLSTYRAFEARALPDVVAYQKAAPAPLAEAARPERFEAPAVARPRAVVAQPAEGPVPAAEPGLLGEARAALASGDLNRAVEAAVARVEAEPGDADACLFLGELAADRGHVVEARLWLTRCVELRPEAAAARYLLALLAAERGDALEALAEDARVLELEPRHVLALQLRARLLREQGDALGAERSLLAAREVLREMPDAAEVPGAQGLTAAELRAVLERLSP